MEERARWSSLARSGYGLSPARKIYHVLVFYPISHTALRVSYQGNVLVYSNRKCNRWYIKFNDNECSGPLPIESVVYNYWPGGVAENYRNHFFEGFCENLARGTVSVELWVGKCSGYSTQGNAYTGWNSVSRIMIEEVPPSQ